MQWFDGVEFDVAREMFTATLGAEHSKKGKRCGDLDVDGRGDDGFFDGVNSYSAGLYHFYELLRQRLGEDRLVMADGCDTTGIQQCYGVLNGVEAEFGFGAGPEKSVAPLWSREMNLFRQWHQFGRAPLLSYVNHKAWSGRWYDVPFSFHRFVMAAGIMCDAAFTHFESVKREPGQFYATFDELLKGTERGYGWLGQPLGEGIRLACRTPDLLGSDPSQAFVLHRLTPFVGTKAVTENGQLRLSKSDEKDAAGCQSTPWPTFPNLIGKDGALGFRLQDIPIPAQGADLLVMVRYRGQPLKVDAANRPREAGIVVSGTAAQSSAASIISFVHREPFEAGFFFSTVPGGSRNLEFRCRGTAPVWIESIRVFAHPDVMIREFDNGLVLVNPSDHPYTFDLERLTPGKRYRRLRGSPQQDPQTNNGLPVEGPVALGPRVGLFLARTGK